MVWLQYFLLAFALAWALLPLKVRHADNIATPSDRDYFAYQDRPIMNLPLVNSTTLVPPIVGVMYSHYVHSGYTCLSPAPYIAGKLDLS